MKIGELKHRITLQKKEINEDDLKQQTEAYIDTTTVWASVEPLSGREYFAAKQENAEITARITLRYFKGVASNMRVVFGSRIFDIISVVNTDERNISLVLMCREME